MPNTTVGTVPNTTVGTVPKSNGKVVERDKTTPLAQPKDDRSRSLLGTDTPQYINKCEFKHVL